MKTRIKRLISDARQRTAKKVTATGRRMYASHKKYQRLGRPPKPEEREDYSVSWAADILYSPMTSTLNPRSIEK